MPWFFAYGISTDPEQMKKDVGTWISYTKATLQDYVYTFTGEHPDFFNQGTSTIIPMPGGTVLGVAYQLEESKISDLVKNGHGYVVRECTANIDGKAMPVLTLQPKTIARRNSPAPQYVSMVRNGLIKHYPEKVVDLYLNRALKRAQINLADFIPVQHSTPEKFKREYGCHFRRLFPWDVTKQQPFGSAWAELNPGENTTPHCHDEEETFVILSGQGTMSVDGETFTVNKGDVIYLEPFSVHTLKNNSNSKLEFLCIWWGAVAV